MDNRLKLTNVIIECGLSKNIVTKINQDKNIEVRALEKICLYLGIQANEAVEFVKG